jgi:5-bromo-4-chloroindolyl phosphate hydrolysis protein
MNENNLCFFKTVNVRNNVNGSQYNIEVIEDKMDVENSVPQLRNNNNTVQNTSNIYNYSPIDCNNNDKMEVDLFY